MNRESEAHDDLSAVESLGQFLQRERNARGITLREISDTTKIGVRYLEALEEDDLEVLPPRAFVVGFIRAYSSCLKIDPEEALLRYERVHSRPEAASSNESPPAEALEDDSRIKRLLVFVLGGLVAAGLFYAVFIKDWSPKARRATGPADSASAVSKRDR